MSIWDALGSLDEGLRSTNINPVDDEAREGVLHMIEAVHRGRLDLAPEAVSEAVSLLLGPATGHLWARLTSLHIGSTCADPGDSVHAEILVSIPGLHGPWDAISVDIFPAPPGEPSASMSAYGCYASAMMPPGAESQTAALVATRHIMAQLREEIMREAKREAREAEVSEAA